MFKNKKELGFFGEDLAARYLEGKDYFILKRNYRSRFGEIDIIAQFFSFLIFIEVKTRTSQAFGWPEESVTKEKRLRIIKTAENFLEKYHIRDKIFQFDVISIELDKQKRIARIKHFKNLNFEV